eukprot:3310549-Rhodomonas_salina.3
MSASTPKPTALLGYDPFGSVSRPGHSDLNNDFESEEGDEHLPDWATEWEDQATHVCGEGEDCESEGNPLGAIGHWVMVKTAPHYNTQRDRHERHSCNGLPGWALEECIRVREHEKGLDDAGHEKPAEEEKAEDPESADANEGQEGEQQEEGAAAAERARPIMLASIRDHPALWAALPARNMRVAQGQRWIMQ